MCIVTVGSRCFSLIFIFFTIILSVNASTFSFELECPNNVTISCSEDTRDLSKFGKAYIWENYVKRDAGPATKIIRDLNDCGAGTIERIWEIEDHNWNIHRCSQIITIKDNAVFGVSDITWPQHFDTSGCTVNLDPQRLKPPYDKPRFNQVGCSKPIFNFKDDVLTFSPTCRKLIRRWRVIDCCQFDPSKPGAGEWIYHQIIKIVVLDTPQIDCPTVIEVSAEDCDGAFVKMDTLIGKDTCGNSLVISNNSKFSDDKGPNAQGKYPIGTTEFYYLTEYACGKTFKCKVKVVVKNDLKPSPYCRNGLIVTLMGMDIDNDGINDDGMIEVWAKDLDIGSFHKCGKRNLKFSFSSDTSDKVVVYSCDSLGINIVELWVTDEFGNQAFCRTYIKVQNNGSNIPDCERDSLNGTIFNIAGNIQSLKGSINHNTSLSLTSPSMYMDVDSTLDSLIRVTRDTFIGKSGAVLVRVTRDTQLVMNYDTTFSDMIMYGSIDSSGGYTFKNLPVDYPYILEPSSSLNSIEGIDMRDAYILMMHLIGWKPMKNPHQLLAADLDADGFITNKDYMILSNAILNGKLPNSLKEYWKFLDSSHQLDVNTVLTSPIPNQINISNLKKDELNNNFISLKMGDINFDAKNSIIHHPIHTRNVNSVVLEMPDYKLISGKSYVIPVSKKNQEYLMGQLELSFKNENLEILKVEDGTAMCNYRLLSNADNHHSGLIFNWLDPNTHSVGHPIALIHLRALKSGFLHNFISINSDLNIQSNIAFSANGDKALTELHFGILEDEVKTPAVDYKFVPNPFIDRTQLQLQTENHMNTSYSLEIYNVVGKIKLKKQGTFDGDSYSLDIYLGDIPDHLLFYKLYFGDNIYSGKLIHLNQ